MMLPSLEVHNTTRLLTELPKICCSKLLTALKVPSVGVLSRLTVFARARLNLSPSCAPTFTVLA